MALAAPPDLGARPSQESEDSLVVVSGTEDALVLLDPDTGQRRAFFRVGSGPSASAISDDGRTAVVALRGHALSGDSICVVDLHAAALVRTIPLSTETARGDGTTDVRVFHRPTGVVFLPGRARVLVTCAGEGALLLVDLLQQRVAGVAQLDGQGADDVVLDHEGRFAYVSDGAAGQVHIVRLETMHLVRSVEAGGGASGIAIHPTRDEVWATNTNTNTISVIDCGAQEERLEFPCGAMPVDLAFTPDGANALVVNHQEGNVSVIDSESLQVRAVVRVPRVSEEAALERPVPEPVAFGRSALPTSVMVDPEGDRAWITARRSDSVHEVSLASFEVTASHAAPGGPVHVAWSSLTPAALSSPIVPIVPLEGRGGVSTDPGQRGVPDEADAGVGSSSPRPAKGP